jgi:hypothetical protein
MNRENQDFDQLRRLLKLKRYEQPPPRYFNSFSAQVLTRLQGAQNSAGGLSWWRRLWDSLELRPMLPAAFGAAVCGVLVFGAVYAENTETAGLGQLNTTSKESTTPLSQLALSESPPLSHPTPTLAFFSTNPLPTSDSLFDQIRPGVLPPMPAGYPLFR